MRYSTLLLPIIFLVIAKAAAQPFGFVPRKDGGIVNVNGFAASSDLNVIALSTHPSQVDGAQPVFDPLQVYSYERDEDQLALITRGIDAPEGNGSSFSTSVSSNGRYIGFSSGASNLVENDTNSHSDCFLYDRQTGELERISTASDGTEANNSCQSWTVVSDDGSVVSFSSRATNLVDGDTNARSDVFVKSRVSGAVVRASVSSSGEQGNEASTFPSISGDGRYLSFTSRASNFLQPPSSTAITASIFLHDRATGETTLVSRGFDFFPANQSCSFSRISNDGKWIAFTCLADNLASNDSNAASDIFLYNRESDSLELISRGLDGDSANGSSYLLSISPDGRFVVFGSRASNLVAGDTNEENDIFLYDRFSNSIVRISIRADGSEIDSRATWGAVNLNGTTAAFATFDADVLASPVAEPQGSSAPLFLTKLDQCPQDELKSEAGVCGCGSSDSDLNANGNADCLDPLASTVPTAPEVTVARKQLNIVMQPFPGANLLYEVVLRGKSRNGKRITIRSSSATPSITVRRKRSVRKWTLRYRITAGNLKTQQSKRLRVKTTRGK